MSRTAQFRQLLGSNALQIVVGAHDALSARIAERAGFGALWASGLGITASIGLRDCSEASVTQVLAVLEYMADATSIPILVDGDSGYGNFNNVRQFTRKLEQLGLAAVCLEDTAFPRKNSFAVGSHDLVSPAEFCGKIRAAKDAQTDENFALIARTETLVAGRSLNECLDRAAAYRDAGADGILVHSAAPDASQVLAFARQWQRRSPLVAVPTTYYRTPIAELEAAGVSMVIWANHLLRASVRAMQSLCEQIGRERTVAAAVPSMTSISELFALLDYDELREAEALYLGSDTKSPAPER
jgi:phosphoenolpyruvate phosphomutase